MAGGVDPSVVDRAQILLCFVIDLVNNGKFIVEVLLLIVNGRDCWQECETTGLMGPTNFIVILLGLDLSEVARNWVFRIGSVPSRVLLLKALKHDFLFVCFILLWEHLQKCIKRLPIVHLLHALEIENSWGWVLLIDRHHSLDHWQSLVLVHVLRRGVNRHEHEVFLEVRVRGKSFVWERYWLSSIIQVDNGDFAVSGILSTN